MTPESQSVHDKINLRRLVTRLEKSISDPNWNEPDRYKTWIKTQRTLQKIKYARKLLKNVEMYEVDPPPKTIQSYRDTEVTLESIESFILDVEKRTTPTITRPEPLLPHIPIPPAIEELTSPPAQVPPLQNIATPLLLPSDQSAHDTPPPASTRPTPQLVTNQNSNSLHQELSDQLTQMATQLKRNAMHFSESLARDQAVVEGAQAKLESNFDTMTKERVRLRDHRGKSGSTTCLVFISLLVVAVSFVLMFFVIRLT